MNFANINDIISLILVMSPSLISITMSILTLFKLLKDFGLVKDKYQKNIDLMQQQITLIKKENSELKKKINELLTAIDHVERKE